MISNQLRANAARQGLALERFILTQLETVPLSQPQQSQEQINTVLHSTGLIQAPHPDLIMTYVTNPKMPRQGSIQIQGQPLSEVIIEQRATKK